MDENEDRIIAVVQRIEEELDKMQVDDVMNVLSDIIQDLFSQIDAETALIMLYRLHQTITTSIETVVENIKNSEEN
jgi:tetrahydromethanopterin S-methyltransferase subunit B